ncbi:MAG: amino acid ABC transporter substrate-binding protein [bacterium]|nr:amino acid ABC transporter substrate-binding protein [bacterium]
MTRKPARLFAAVAICCLTLVVTSCTKKAVKVGVVLPLSGENSTYGEAIRKGVELAFEEIQADPDAGGALEISVVDTASDAKKAAELLEQEFANGALIAVGGATSVEAKEMVTAADQAEKVLISPSASSPELTGISRNFYRIFPSDFAAATKMAQFASQDLKAKRIVVITEQQSYAKGIHGVFGPAFEGYGGEVVEVIEVPPGTSDLGGLMDRVMTLKPDAVYLAGFEQGIGAMIQELRRLNFKGRILTTSAFALPSAIARVGKAAAGVILTQSVFELDSDFAHVKKFVEAYEAKYGEQPDIYAAHGYDAMRVVAQAVTGRPALTGEVIKGLRDVKDFPGVTGSIQFDEKGDVRKFPRLYLIGEDLLLYDYNERVRKQQDEVRRRKAALMQKLEKIQKQASEIKN